MVERFFGTSESTYKENIPNKVIQCNAKDPSWISHEIKGSTNRRHRVYMNFVWKGKKDRGLKERRGSSFISLKQLVARAKENCYRKLGRRLSDLNSGTKTLWFSL